jgi:V/A-type H+-transporting ATPase subunit K
MDPETVTTTLNQTLGVSGAVASLAIPALGSAIGHTLIALAAVGAWKKCYLQNKQAPFLLLTFVGVPLTQVLYGIILMFSILEKASEGGPGPLLLVLGVVAGLVIGVTAVLQARVSAAATDSQAETGQGFTNYLAAIGILETTAIFTMVFSLIIAGQLKG